MILAFLSGCATTPSLYNEDGTMKMYAPGALMMRGLPEGDSSYDKGFRDGCHTAIGITGEALQRIHGFEYDVNRGIEDKEYYKGYRMGTVACVYYLDYDIL